MNLKHLSDKQLNESAKTLSQEIAVKLIELLHHLMEIERRRLFSSYKCDSLHTYCIRELGFSDDEAVRRIAAMRVLREVPEAEQSVRSGEITLTNLSLVQKVGKTRDEKLEFIEQFKGKSTREAMKIAGIKKEITFNSIQDDELREKLLRIQGRYVHKNGGVTLVELLHQLADQELEKLGAQRVGSDTVCENCGSFFALEWDHIVPRGLGGGDVDENLRLLCRACNQRSAIMHFGLGKMQNHLS